MKGATKASIQSAINNLKLTIDKLCNTFDQVITCTTVLFNEEKSAEFLKKSGEIGQIRSEVKTLFDAAYDQKLKGTKKLAKLKEEIDALNRELDYYIVWLDGIMEEYPDEFKKITIH